MAVFIKAGTHVGSENPAGYGPWTRIVKTGKINDQCCVVGNVFTEIPGATFDVPPGGIVGLYHVTGGFSLNQGRKVLGTGPKGGCAVGDVVASTADLEVLCGQYTDTLLGSGPSSPGLNREFLPAAAPIVDLEYILN